MAVNREHILPVYSPPDELFVRGEGAWLYTDKNERYLDFIAGIAVNALGHAHPRLTAALTEQANKVWHLSNMFRIEGQEPLSKAFTDNSFADLVFFTNSGTEAVEGALKLARKYQAASGAPEKIDIIGFDGAFHGRTYAAVNAAGNASHLEGFGPRLPGYLQARYNDIASVEALAGPTTAAIIIEPVQGEGGVRAASDEFLRALRALCDKLGALLIYDEVQSGAGRTGKLWAHEWSGITPDVMATAKGIGGGFPLGALLATKEAAKGMVVASHGSTYGGNPLAMAVGQAAFAEISNPDFLQRVRDVSNQFGQALEGLKDRHPDLITEVRGKGLLRGLKMTIDTKALQGDLRQRKLLVGVASGNVLRMTPPLIIDEAQISQAVDTIDAALAAKVAAASA